MKAEANAIEAARQRLEAETQAKQSALEKLQESNRALMEAQAKMSKLHNEEFRVNEYQPQPVVAETQQPQKPQQPRLSQIDLEWQKNNPWFEKDTIMRGTAMGLHEQIKQKGIVPGSEQYYKEIDEGMRKIFPDKFEVQQEAPELQNGTVVAPVERSGKKSRTVRLTRTQVALAKRLGLSPEQYAAQLMKEQSNG